MRLTDLSPSWIYQKGKRVVGVRFLCPCCHQLQLGALFLNCPDGATSQPNDPDFTMNNWGNRWSRSGLTFDDLTLSPAIDASADGHWHGHINDGNLITESVAVDIDSST